VYAACVQLGVEPDTALLAGRLDGESRLVEGIGLDQHPTGHGLADLLPHLAGDAANSEVHPSESDWGHCHGVSGCVPSAPRKTV